MSKLNQAAVKRHALECSKRFKNGKFSRVGTDFLDDIDATVEAVVRKFAAIHPVVADAPLITCDDFTTPELREALVREFNCAIARIIQNGVKCQPSVGQTLGRTH